jgi:hypothetical protein
VLLLPVSGELPFPDGLDLEGDAGFWRVERAPAAAMPGGRGAAELDRIDRPDRLYAGRRTLPVTSARICVFSRARGTRDIVSPIDPVLVPVKERVLALL